MSGKPCEGALEARAYLCNGHSKPDVAKICNLSLRHVQRIAASLGISPNAVGRPRSVKK